MRRFKPSKKKAALIGARTRQHRAGRAQPAPTLSCSACESPDVVAAITDEEGNVTDYCAECNLQRQVGGA
jgi:hypothetical protein